jgi:hypothetical protein
MTTLATKRTELCHFPLSEAYICLELDCGRVHNSNAYCPCCASCQIQPLSRWIAELAKKVQP